jgi:hypothetical protein
MANPQSVANLASPHQGAGEVSLSPQRQKNLELTGCFSLLLLFLSGRHNKQANATLSITTEIVRSVSI